MSAYTNIDNIVKSILLQRGLTIHWYFPYLKLATDCLRELHFDVLQLTETRVVESVDGVIKFPCGCIDVVRIYGYDETNEKKTECKIPKEDVDHKNRVVNIKKSRFPDGKYFMEYIGDGNTCDAATKVHPYAQKTIETYVIWKKSPNKDNEFSAEGNEYARELKKLRARFSDMGEEDFQEIFKIRTHIRLS